MKKEHVAKITDLTLGMPTQPPELNLVSQKSSYSKWKLDAALQTQAGVDLNAAPTLCISEPMYGTYLQH